MKILLGVCGSISAYKSLDICRQLFKDGHEVKVVLTKGALEFVRPQVFKYLGAQEVFSPEDDFNPHAIKDRSVLHIDLSKWAQRILIAPASANTLAKLSAGMCDDLLSSIFLASPNTPCVIFPAMNTNMLKHPLTKNNFDRLEGLENVFIHPTKEGLLACGDEGEGKLADVELIAQVVPVISFTKTNKRILITTGATIAPLDPVRFLTNPSSGKTGYELAKSYLSNGNEVTLIAGRNSCPQIDYLSQLPNAKVIRVSTTAQVFELVKELFDKHDLYISSAALSDIQFEQSSVKLKKDQFQDKLSISKAPDVLKEMLKRKTTQKIIGFAAETNNNIETFEKKWKDKPVDVLVGNIVAANHDSESIGFGTNVNTYTILKEGRLFFTGPLAKAELAEKIEQALKD
ncbi:MAG: bifunctional phosphopantothenoylcysteine decarboxylase/phosphopantothenate--cysteine ligase CoaBC [Bacteriovoracaceae bacterium]|nr:bifunctional phosphopantothenoylcysteine decarboxylase/phosphopantothenate--cysteine ligase CoaBC [Bacteriovoracaceae bacterium]